MKFGPNAHAVFQKNLRRKGLLERIIPPFLFALPAVSYYLNDDSVETRIYLHNYFSLLGDTETARARWSLEVYSPAGKCVASEEGEFTGAESVVIEIGKFRDIGPFGLLLIRMIPLDDEAVLDRPFHAIYYTEYTRKHPAKEQKIIYHSLGSPVGSIFNYARDNYTSGSFFPPEAKPYLLIANGSLLRLGNSMSEASGIIDIINSEGKSLVVKLPSIASSLGSFKVDIFKECPEFEKHIAGKPFSLKIKGRNILSKAFWYVYGDNVFVGEHF